MLNNKYVLIRNLAALFIAGNLVNWLFPFPAIVWRVSLVLLALFVIIFKEGKRLPCENAILVFVVLNLVYFFISYLWEKQSTTQIGNVLCALLPLSLFTYLSERKVMTDRFITGLSAVLLVCALFNYNYFLNNALDTIGADNDTSITNNASTPLLMILPMIFLMKNNIQKWITLLVCLFFIVASAKRGNILAAVIPIVLFVWNSMKATRHNVIKSILVLGIVVGAGFAIYREVLNNDYLLLRITQTQEGNSSGRNMIFAGAWRAWYDSNDIVTYILGYGYDGTVHQELTTHHHAHNDWLEVLVDYGLLGIVLYLVVMVSLFFQIKKIKSNEMRLAFMAGVFIWLFKTFYSMGFTEETMSLVMISMGTVLGECKRKGGGV